MNALVNDIVAHACNQAFGKVRVVNVLRSILVEAIVDRALPDGWTWCSSDYAAYDFRHDDGTRLEVKQSAALQSWKAAKPSAPIFDVAPRTGYWKDGIVWAPEFGRHTDIYLFAHHPVVDDTVDHRNPYQWDFYLLPAVHIPDPKRKTITLSSIRFLKASLCKFDGLGVAVESMRALL